ncbi:MAG: tetratricopeptide repeat protein [Planctomycetota bacterium]
MRRVVGGLLALLTSNWSCAPAPNANPTRLAESGSATPDSVTLDPIVLPFLGDLEPAVREQLTRAIAECHALLGPAAPPDRGGGADRIGELGMQFHAYGLCETAAQCYQRAESQSADFRWPYYRAQLLWSEGRAEEAIAALRRCLELETTYVPAHLLLAKILLEQNDLESARRSVTAAGEGAPPSAAALTLLGRVAMREGDVERAIELLTRALELAPKAGEVHYLLGLAYREHGDVKRARAHLEYPNRTSAPVDDPLMDALKGRIVGSRLRQNLGGEHFLRQEFSQARAEYELAVKADPTSSTAHSNLGAVLTRLGDLPAARKHFEMARALAPENALVHFNLGTLSAREGLDTQAISHYEACLAIDPDYGDAHFNLGNALRRVRRFETASQHYQRAVDLDPSNGEARLALAHTWIVLERMDEALPLLELSHRARPQDLATAETLARVFAASSDPRQRDGGRAHAIAQALLERERSVSHVETYAMALAQLGHFDQARTWLEAAVAAADKLGRPDLIANLELGIARCLRQETWPGPWPREHPILMPPARPRATLEPQER